MLDWTKLPVTSVDMRVTRIEQLSLELAHVGPKHLFRTFHWLEYVSRGNGYHS